MPSTKIVQLLSEVHGDKLLLEMTQVSDRFRTRILRFADPGSNQSWQLATSVEGLSKEQEALKSDADSESSFDPNWPPSPPLQEVVPQTNSDGDYLAGVGRCGKSHWSVIVTPLKDVLGFDFDFACRVKAEPTWLGSTYEIGENDRGSSMSVDVIRGVFAPSNSPGMQGIQPETPYPATYPATIQWRYRLIARV